MEGGERAAKQRKTFPPCRQFNLTLAAVRRALRAVSASVLKIYGVDFKAELVLSGGCSSCNDMFKEFKYLTGGLLDSYQKGAKHHPLKTRLDAVGSKKTSPTRFKLTVASALASGKKLLPKTCSCMSEGLAESHREKMTRMDQEVPDGEKYKIKKIIGDVFPSGFDEKYVDYVDKCTLSVGACREKGRGDGGAAGLVKDGDRDIFRAVALGKIPIDKLTHEVSYCEVLEKGKTRGITITSLHHQLLRPVHKMLYDRLSGKPWLLRGEPDTKSFKDFVGLSRDEILVSGDYESATDNLSLNRAEFILKCIMDRCTTVPDEVRGYAIKSLRMKINYPDGKVIDQTRGQLMGSLLSFPLLCLQNYIGVKLSLPFVKDREIRINGDDIVLRIRKHEFKIWKEAIRSMGLILSSGKSFVSRSFFCLNSTYFWSKKRNILKLPVARLGMLDPSAGFDSSLGDDHNYFVSPMRGYARNASRVFIEVHKHRIFRSGRSMTQEYPLGLGMRMKSSWVTDFNDIDREVWFNETVTYASPMPQPPVGNTLKCPPGFIKVDVNDTCPEEIRSSKDSFAEACTREKWKGYSKDLEYLHSIDEKDVKKKEFIHSEKTLEGKRRKIYEWEMKAKGFEPMYRAYRSGQRERRFFSKMLYRYSGSGRKSRDCLGLTRKAIGRWEERCNRCYFPDNKKWVHIKDPGDGDWRSDLFLYLRRLNRQVDSFDQFLIE